jgi:hypothetical protein
MKLRITDMSVRLRAVAAVTAELSRAECRGGVCQRGEARLRRYSRSAAAAQRLGGLQPSISRRRPEIAACADATAGAVMQHAEIMHAGQTHCCRDLSGRANHARLE